MTQNSILNKLRTPGFDIEEVSHIPGKVEDALVIESGELVRWFYLIPQEELSKECEKEMNELAKKLSDG